MCPSPAPSFLVAPLFLNCHNYLPHSTCAQVRFVHECMRGMQPGVPLSALHGKIKQERRTIIYMDFLRKKHACLFATDIAARWEG